METRKQPFDPSGRDLLRFFCFAAIFYAAFMAAAGLVTTLQLYDSQIPSGTVQAVRHSKSGFVLTNGDGEQGTLPFLVAYGRASPIQPMHGDRVAKARSSMTYFFNGQPLAGWRWALRTCLLPVHTVVMIAVYLVLSGAYAALYGRSPIADQFRTGRRDRQPFTIGGSLGALAAAIVTLCAIITAEVIALGGVVFGLFGLLRQLR